MSIAEVEFDSGRASCGLTVDAVLKVLAAGSAPVAIYGSDQRRVAATPSYLAILDNMDEAALGAALRAAEEAGRVAVRIEHAGATVSLARETDGGIWCATAAAASAPIHRDSLTGLPHRGAFHRELALVAAEREQRECAALLLLDLDRFKSVNDTLGHPIGDELLIKVVGRLQNAAAGRLIGRLGGDEFAILLKDAVDPRGEAASLADRLVEVVGRSYLVCSQLVSIGLSIGIACFEEADENNPDRVLARADLALYSAKENGRGCWRHFHEELERSAVRRRELEQDVRRALALRQFEVFYQPKVDARSARITGCEALLRWRHPERGMVPPDLFIPLAEETGIIVAIGEWVLRKACETAAQWPETWSLAVNLSPVQVLHPKLVESVVGILAQTGFPSNRLELEITEGVLLKDSEKTLQTLSRLREIGVKIAMDDFGTGYSSLGYLRAFPFTRVKIDQSFIRQMDERADAAAIVRAVLALGESLGMSVTAEGVETAKQRDALRENKCDELQGYFFSRPVPADGLAKFVEAERLDSEEQNDEADRLFQPQPNDRLHGRATRRRSTNSRKRQT